MVQIWKKEQYKKRKQNPNTEHTACFWPRLAVVLMLLEKRWQPLQGQHPGGVGVGLTPSRCEEGWKPFVFGAQRKVGGGGCNRWRGDPGLQPSILWSHCLTCHGAMCHTLPWVYQANCLPQKILLIKVSITNRHQVYQHHPSHVVSHHKHTHLNNPP